MIIFNRIWVDFKYLERLMKFFKNVKISLGFLSNISLSVFSIVSMLFILLLNSYSSNSSYVYIAKLSYYPPIHYSSVFKKLFPNWKSKQSYRAFSNSQFYIKISSFYFAFLFSFFSAKSWLRNFSVSSTKTLRFDSLSPVTIKSLFFI